MGICLDTGKLCKQLSILNKKSISTTKNNIRSLVILKFSYFYLPKKLEKELNDLLLNM